MKKPITIESKLKKFPIKANSFWVRVLHYNNEAGYFFHEWVEFKLPKHYKHMSEITGYTETKPDDLGLIQPLFKVVYNEKA